MAPRWVDDERIRRVRVMADHGAFPLWATPDHSDGPEHAIGDLRPDDLPLSADLVTALRAWVGVYERLSSTDSTWPSPDARSRWNEQGRSLARWVRHELGPDYEVVFFDDLAGEEVDPDRRARRSRRHRRR